MNGHLTSWYSHWRWILIGVGFPVLVATWWAFRPEKLWVNQKVNEAAPFASSTDPQPLYTGRLEGKAHQTTGRATIYSSADGKQYLRLTDFSTSNGPDVHVYLVAAPDAKDDATVKNAGFVDLGSMKGNVGDQNYDVPSSVDLARYQAVTIWCARFNVNFATAPLTASN